MAPQVEKIVNAEEEARRKRAGQFERALQRSGINPEQLLIKLLRVEEAAELLGNTVSGIQSLTFRRRIPVVRVGKSVRYRMLDLLVWVEEHTEPARN